jgi:cytochrome b pre-mRNA-processing protein 3
MVFPRWLRPPSPQPAAEHVYGQLVDRARAPAFYARYGVPDTLDGRFEMVALHAFLALHRLKRDGAAGAELAQALFDTMFADMDRSLREIGVSDLAVGKRVRDMAQALYGRIAAYEAGIDAGPGALEQALARNVYGTAPAAPAPALAALAAYMRAALERLGAAPSATLADGLPWPAIPEPGI